MRGYLLDTNVVCYWFDERSEKHVDVTTHIDQLSDAMLFVSAVSLGEIAFGHRCESKSPTTIQLGLSSFVRSQLPHVVDVKRATAQYFGEIKARIFGKFSKQRGRKKQRLRQLTDPLSGEELGVDENDLWIAACAVEHNLVLVTYDKMARLREVTNDVLDFEDWAAATD